LKANFTRSAVVLLAIGALYFGGAALVLRSDLDRLLFLKTPAFAGPVAKRVEHIRATTGAEILVRRYGHADRGCVVFFPGQHGYLPTYDPSGLTGGGLEVWLVAYPGQDGAAGNATIAVVEDLATRVVRMAFDHCAQGRVVMLGVSLGAMLAARASVGSQPAGVVLVSAATSLSDAIRSRLAAKWYLSPLRLLPLSRILKRDYTLSEGLPSHSALAIFQGTADEQAPLAALRESLPPEYRYAIVRVEGGTHATTFALSKETQLSTILRLLSQSEPKDQG
jgi:hypothetical protein